MMKKAGLIFAGFAFLGAQVASAALVDDFLDVADAEPPQCIETVAAALIIEQGVENAGPIVQAAIEALALREEEQKLAGCSGDIAGEAIAAGADPNDVLTAAAAGLGPNGGAPATLGGAGTTLGGGAGDASAS